MIHEWKRSYDLSGDYFEDLNGIPWHDAPKPPPILHRCHAKTRGVIGLEYIERCACGAIRLGGEGRWMERNSR